MFFNVMGDGESHAIGDKMTRPEGEAMLELLEEAAQHIRDQLAKKPKKPTCRVAGNVVHAAAMFRHGRTGSPASR